MTGLHQLSTSHGSIVVEEAGHGDLPVLLIHGNSLSREVFRKQLGGALSTKYRSIAFDLPGHKDSSDALNASRTPGLADAAIEALGRLGLREVVVVGWSLGGHIALEMASQSSGIKGLLVCGAPPVSRHNMAEGFIPRPHMKLAGSSILGHPKSTRSARQSSAHRYRSRFGAQWSARTASHGRRSLKRHVAVSG